jgi:hypothetical protein
MVSRAEFDVCIERPLLGACSPLPIIIVFRRCVHYGVLPHKEAEKINKIVMARKKGVRTGDSSPVPPPKKKKAKVASDMANPDMQVSGAERVLSAII